MKIILAFFLVSVIGFSQNKSVQIHKVKYEYKIKDVVNLVSFVPQIKMDNKVVQNKINKDIKRHFNATSQLDKTTYTKNVLKENNVKTVQEYKKFKDDELQGMLQEDPNYYEDREEESYQVEFLSNNLLNISVCINTTPYRGRCGLTFASFCYDLKTGKKLEFKDFFSINQSKLIEILTDKGYFWEPTDVGEPLKFEKIEPNNEYVEHNIKDLFLNTDADGSCIDFYFTKIENKTHLIFNFQCAGPMLQEYGISLEYLKPYLVKYFK